MADLPGWAGVGIAVVALALGVWQWWQTERRERRRDAQNAELLRQQQLISSRQAVDRVVSRWRLSGLRSLSLATDPDVRAVAASAKRLRHSAAADQASVAAASPAGKSLPYHLIDEAARILIGFEGVIDPIALRWTPDQRDLWEVDPEWKDRLQRQLDEMQNQMNSTIDRLDTASTTELSTPEAKSEPAPVSS
jgi:hypothetical protein